MSAQWEGLIREKLFMARSLAEHSIELAASNTGPAAGVGLQAGLAQGAAALTLQAREALLVLIAQLNQSKITHCSDLSALSAELGEANPDVSRVMALSAAGDSWWRRLDELQQSLAVPRQAPRQPDEDDLIAIAAASDRPDSSPEALLKLNRDMKDYVAELCLWHGEW